MGGKTIFPNGHLNEEVNIDSPNGFKDSSNSNGVTNSKCSMSIKLYSFGDPTIYYFCVNRCVIDISKNHVQHSKTKHIDM